MQVLTTRDLFRLTRAELFGLHRQLVAALAALPEGSPERPVILANLRRIARTLAAPCPTPG